MPFSMQPTSANGNDVLILRQIQAFYKAGQFFLEFLFFCLIIERHTLVGGRETDEAGEI